MEHYRRWHRYGDPLHKPRRYGIDPTATHKECSKCRKTLPVDAFHKKSKRLGHYFSACKECRKLTPEQWLHKSVSGYGITGEQYLQLLDHQDHACAICKTTVVTGNGKRLSVDHDHETGKVRGLLCNNCNVAIGMLNDDVETLRAAIEYLTQEESGRQRGR